jgi:transposase-like protein
MERRRFTREFKLEAVKLVTERGVTIAQAARDLEVSGQVLRRWVKELEADQQQASGSRPAEGGPGRGHPAETGSRQAQSRARYSKKSRGLLREGQPVKFAFIAKHRGVDRSSTPDRRRRNGCAGRSVSRAVGSMPG